MSPTLAGGFLTTGPLGKSHGVFLKYGKEYVLIKRTGTAGAEVMSQILLFVA